MDEASVVPARESIQSAAKELSIEALAEFVAATVQAGQTLLLVVPDDAWLPELSNALDLTLRPLCLVLPGQGFAAGIALRATLALLKSRLARGNEAAWSAAWEAQRTRLEQHAALWQLTLNWSSAGDAYSAWPAQIDELFPICILPSIHAETIAGAPRDLVLLLHPERMTANAPKLLTLGKRALLLQDADATVAGRLVAVDEQTRLNAEYQMLAQELGDMELEFATVQAELAEFTRVYHAQVGARMTELDALQARIASCYADRISTDEAAQFQAAQARSQAERSQREHRNFAELDRETEKPFAPSSDMKRLFRQLAQKIHPDRAEDENDRAWRTELMSEANRAYRAGDEMVLREILSQWQSGRHDQPSEKSPNATTPGLARQVSRMQRRLAEIEAELNRLLASRLYELFVAAGMARQRGRDLLQEMVEQLDAQIDQARLRLEQLETA
ncbi:MAG: J domain-containing protein [Proteobacteria bacterium]|nr:J domain-containing protein [Pseudomonadota bacterium]